MKTNSFSAALTILLVSAAIGFAQSSSKFGLKGGAIFERQEFQYRGSTEHSSYDVGIYLNSSPANWISMMAELHLVQKGSFKRDILLTESTPSLSLLNVGLPERVHYASIPLLVKLSPEWRKFSPFLTAGPRVDFLLSDVSSEFLEFAQNYARINWGGSFGLGIQNQWLSFELRWEYSHTHYYDSDFLRAKHNSMVMLVGIGL
ncbi:MAG: outer membrane beta-barrel protein [bacterium]